jgi:hypothetical protein
MLGSHNSGPDLSLDIFCRVLGTSCLSKIFRHFPTALVVTIYIRFDGRVSESQLHEWQEMNVLGL